MIAGRVSVSIRREPTIRADEDGTLILDWPDDLPMADVPREVMVELVDRINELQAATP